MVFAVVFFFSFVFMNIAKYLREQQKLLMNLLEVEGTEKTVSLSLVFSFFPSSN